MRKISKRILVFILTFIISFNVVSTQFECSKVHASATAIGLSEVVQAIAASLGVNLPGALALAGGVMTTYVCDSFVSYVTGVDSSELDIYDRIGAGAVASVGITGKMVNDVKGWLETLGIETKSGTVAEKTVSISSGVFTWFESPGIVYSYFYRNGDAVCVYSACAYLNGNIKFAPAYISNGNNSAIYFITDVKDQYFYKYSLSTTSYTMNDLKTLIYNDYIKNYKLYAPGGASKYNCFSFATDDYYVYSTTNACLANINPSEILSTFDSSKIAVFDSLDDLKTALGGKVSSVDITIPSIGTYDDANISNLTDGRTLSAADLQAIADAINNPYADYKNSDGAITQEDLQAAVTAAIAAALAAAGEKEEPDNPTDDPVITAGFQGVFDWFQKVFDLLKTFFATATTFVTTFPLKLWKDALETFPVTLSNIQDAVGDVYKVGEQISEALITFPTAESLNDLITGVPADLVDLKDAVTIFPKAFQDAMTGVITDVFPAALIGALEDALPSYIAAGVTALPLTLVDILIPQLDLSIPKALEGSLPKILTDALAGSIVLPDIKVDFPAIEIPNYMDILSQILAAILSIPALLTLDVPAIKTAVQSATKDVALETGLEPIVTLFEGIRFDDNITYPVIAIDTPDILKKFYQEPQIILLDFEDYAQYCQWARNIFRVTLWLAFLYWAAKQLQVHYHIG